MGLFLEDVSHRFGTQQALQGVSVRVEPGDCYGFIGHNGAGKTTAMRVMLGLLVPDRGRVIVDGFDARAHPREARARMGALIETPGFHPGWSGRQNLRLLDRLGGKRSDLDGLLDLVGLSHAGSKPVRAYSQGMRQRLGVAQALLGEPDYILLDEPSNGLDPDGIREMRELLLTLTRDEGRTVFISSHQLHELAGICNRVGVLRQGRLVLEESLERLLVRDRFALVTPDRARAAEVLTGAGLAVVSGDELIVELGERDPGAILRGLIDGGINVQEFAARPPTLEDIYYRHEPGEPEGREAREGREQPQQRQPPPPVEVGAVPERKAPGRPLARMLGHELRRWLGQATVPLMLALPAGVGLLAMLIRRGGVIGDRQEVMEGTLASATDVNAFEAVTRSLHVGVWLLCYIVLGLASQSIAGEFQQGTLRNILLRPFGRLQVVAGKAIAVIGAALDSYLFLVLVSIGAAAIAFEFTGATEILANGQPFPLVPEEELWPEFWHMLWSPLLPLAAYAGIGFLCGSVVRRGATALGSACRSESRWAGRRPLPPPRRRHPRVSRAG